MLRAVVSEKADFTVIDESVFYLANGLGLGQFIEAIVPVGAPFDVTFNLRNDSPELVSIFNKGLKSISEEELREMRNRWLLCLQDPNQMTRS